MCIVVHSLLCIVHCASGLLATSSGHLLQPVECASQLLHHCHKVNGGRDLAAQLSNLAGKVDQGSTLQNIRQPSGRKSVTAAQSKGQHPT
jgi:hypothetical protein